MDVLSTTQSHMKKKIFGASTEVNVKNLLITDIVY